MSHGRNRSLERVASSPLHAGVPALTPSLLSLPAEYVLLPILVLLTRVLSAPRLLHPLPYTYMASHPPLPGFPSTSHANSTYACEVVGVLFFSAIVVLFLLWHVQLAVNGRCDANMAVNHTRA